jgi:hypothetical protein
LVRSDISRRSFSARAVGILIDGSATSGAIALNVRDSVISGSTAQGLGVFEATSGGPSAVVPHDDLPNGAQGIFASRALAAVRVRQSVISGNAVGVAAANGGQMHSRRPWHRSLPFARWHTMTFSVAIARSPQAGAGATTTSKARSGEPFSLQRGSYRFLHPPTFIRPLRTRLCLQ